MKLPYLTALPAIVVCLAISLVVSEHQTRLQLTNEHQTLEQQCQQMEDLIARNQQLSNLLAQATAPEPLSPDQQMELLRLRVAKWDCCGNRSHAFDQARAENQQARDVLEKYRLIDGTNVSTTNFWPQGTWVNAGYATPEAAFQTSLWAGYNGDLTNFTASLSGDADTNFSIISARAKPPRNNPFGSRMNCMPSNQSRFWGARWWMIIPPCSRWRWKVRIFKPAEW